MKFKKIVLFLLIVTLINIIFGKISLSLISLNEYYSLPVYDNLYFKIIGSIFLSVGILILIYCVILHLKTGRKTPFPVIEEPKQLIVGNFYKYCRNPMYLTEIVILLGNFFLTGYFLLLPYTLIVFLIIHLFVIYIEEPELYRIFGKDYKGYVMQVPRWIPSFKVK